MNFATDIPTSHGGSYHLSCLIIVTEYLGIFIVLGYLLEYDGWKLITDEKIITKKLILGNSIYLSISGDSPFAQEPLVGAVGLYGKGSRVGEMLQRIFDTVKAGMNCADASTEMCSFLKALQLQISGIIGTPAPTMKI